MLNVNSTSSTTGGSGRIIIASTREQAHAARRCRCASACAKSNFGGLWLSAMALVLAASTGGSMLGGGGGAAPLARAARSW